MSAQPGSQGRPSLSAIQTTPGVVSQQPQHVPPPIAAPIHRRTYHEPDDNLKELNRGRFEGYRVFTRWVASDQTYFLVRKFTSLNVRIILALQDEIVKLEQELNELDEDWSRPQMPASVNFPDPDIIHNGTFREDIVERRKELLKDLTKRTKYYNEYVNEYSQLARQPPPKRKDIENVEGYLDEHYGTIEDAEAQYIKKHEDLISVQPKIRSWFRGILEMTRCLKLPGIKQIFTRQPSDYQIINDGHGYWQNDTRVERLSTGFIAIVGLGMLLGPLWWLNTVEAQAKRLGIITAFIALFFVLVAVATTARVVDALAAAAAYSAVLMVFMQLQSSGH